MRPTFRIPDIGRRFAGVAAVQAIRAVSLAVGSDLEYALCLREPVVPPVGRAAPVLARTTAVGQELVGQDFKRICLLYTSDAADE